MESFLISTQKDAVAGLLAFATFKGWTPEQQDLQNVLDSETPLHDSSWERIAKLATVFAGEAWKYQDKGLQGGVYKALIWAAVYACSRQRHHILIAAVECVLALLQKRYLPASLKRQLVRDLAVIYTPDLLPQARTLLDGFFTGQPDLARHLGPAGQQIAAGLAPPATGEGMGGAEAGAAVTAVPASADPVPRVDLRRGETSLLHQPVLKYHYLLRDPDEAVDPAVQNTVRRYLGITTRILQRLNVGKTPRIGRDLGTSAFQTASLALRLQTRPEYVDTVRLSQVNEVPWHLLRSLAAFASHCAQKSERRAAAACLEIIMRLSMLLSSGRISVEEVSGLARRMATAHGNYRRVVGSHAADKHFPNALILTATNYLGRMPAGEGRDLVDVFVSGLADIIHEYPDLFHYSERNELIRQALRHGTTREQDLAALHGQRPGRRNYLSFLSPDDQERFQQSLEEKDHRGMRELLAPHTDAVLGAAAADLQKGGVFDNLRSPFFPVDLRAPHSHRYLYPEARRLIKSDNPADIGLGRKYFRDALSAHNDTLGEPVKSLMREWELYALAREKGADAALGDWEVRLKSGEASASELWNVCITYLDFADQQVGAYDRILALMRPAIDNRCVTFSHFRLALYVALRRVQAARTAGEAPAPDLLDFLRQNLVLWPEASATLAWLVLSGDADLATLGSARSALATFLAEQSAIPQATAPDSRQKTLKQYSSFKDYLEKTNLRCTWLYWIRELAMCKSIGIDEWEEVAHLHAEDGNLRAAQEAMDIMVARALKKLDRRALEKENRLQLEVAAQEALTVLFTFYTKQPDLAERARSDAALYARVVPDLWAHGNHDRANQLLKVSRPFLDPEGERSIMAARDAAQGERGRLLGLLRDLDLVRGDLERLLELEPQILHALRDLRGQEEEEDVLQRIEGVLRGFRDLAGGIPDPERAARLQEINDMLADLGQRAARMHGRLQNIRLLATVMTEVLAVQADQHGRPRFVVEVAEGLDEDSCETSLVVQLHNPWQGGLQNLVLLAETAGGIAPRGESRVRQLGAGERLPVSIPLRILRLHGSPIRGRLRVQYDWGVLRRLVDVVDLSIPTTSFALALENLGRRTLVAPFPLGADVSQEREVGPHYQAPGALVAALEQHVLQPAETGLAYLFGLPRSGKTSLLKYLGHRLEAQGYWACRLDLSHLSPGRGAEARHAKALTEALRAHLGSEAGAAPAPVASPSGDLLQPLEALMMRLVEAARARGRQLLILVDEAPQLAPALRGGLWGQWEQLARRGEIRVILAGRQDPVALREADPGIPELTGYSQASLEREGLGALLAGRLVPQGIRVAEAAMEQILRQTGGHPHLVALIGNTAVDLLAAERRLELSPNDVELIAADLAERPGTFATSLLDPAVISREDRLALEHLSRAALPGEDWLDPGTVARIVTEHSPGLLRKLARYGLVDCQPDTDRYRIRARMLLTHLVVRRGKFAPLLLSGARARPKVGIFVDIENVRMQTKESLESVALALRRYAEEIGEVRHASVASFDERDGVSLQTAFKGEGFAVEFVDPCLKASGYKSNAADDLLKELIDRAVLRDRPDVVIICSCDKDFYEKAKTLLLMGISVHIAVATAGSATSTAYEELRIKDEEERLRMGLSRSRMTVVSLARILDDKLGAAAQAVPAALQPQPSGSDTL